MKVIYKITYPNSKIYIGKGLTGTLCYFGSPNSELIVKDLSPKQMQDFSIRKQILREFVSAPDSVVNAKEVEPIRQTEMLLPVILLSNLHERIML